MLNPDIDFKQTLNFFHDHLYFSKTILNYEANTS